MAAKNTCDLLADFLEMLSEKEEEIKHLVSVTRQTMIEGLDYDKLETLNERAREVFDLDEQLEETYRSLAVQLVPSLVQLYQAQAESHSDVGPLELSAEDLT